MSPIVTYIYRINWIAKYTLTIKHENLANHTILKWVLIIFGTRLNIVWWDHKVRGHYLFLEHTNDDKVMVYYAGQQKVNEIDKLSREKNIKGKPRST